MTILSLIAVILSLSQPSPLRTATDHRTATGAQEILEEESFGSESGSWVSAGDAIFDG
jgi:hypothetical protein